MVLNSYLPILTPSPLLTYQQGCKLIFDLEKSSYKNRKINVPLTSFSLLPLSVFHGHLALIFLLLDFYLQSFFTTGHTLTNPTPTGLTPIHTFNQEPAYRTTIMANTNGGAGGGPQNIEPYVVDEAKRRVHDAMMEELGIGRRDALRKSSSSSSTPSSLLHHLTSTIMMIMAPLSMFIYLDPLS